MENNVDTMENTVDTMENTVDTMEYTVYLHGAKHTLLAAKLPNSPLQQSKVSTLGQTYTSGCKTPYFSKEAKQDLYMGSTIHF